MNRHRAYWPLDDSPETDGDRWFAGVNSRDYPEKLGDGYLAAAENVRCVGGRIRPRGGVRLLAWTNRVSDPFDPMLIIGYNTVHGASTFSDPVSGIEWLIVVSEDDAGNLAAWRSSPGTGSQALDVRPGQPAGSVHLVQTWSGLVMLRGPDLDPLIMSDINEGFRAVDEPESPYTRIPPSSFGLYHQNRLLVVDGRIDPQYVDSLWVSDYGDTVDVLRGPSSYWNNFRFNPGTVDRLVSVYPLSDTTLCVFKTGAVYLVSGIAGITEEIAATASRGDVTTEYGCLAPRSVLRVGRDVWFLAHRVGIASVALTQQNEAQAVDVPVSLPLDDIVQRINWEAASGACAAFWANRAYFAVPVDGSVVNNVVLVWDTLNQAWSGYDTGPAISIRQWLKFTWLGEERLGFVSDTGHLYLYEHGYADQTANAEGVITWHDVRMRVRTRGYGGRVSGRKVFGRLNTRLATSWPTIGVTTYLDGSLRGQELRSGITSDRTAYLKVGRGSYDVTNVNDDHGAPDREDYSVIPPVQPNTSGIQPDVLAERPYSWPARRSGQYLQVEIENTTGTCEVASVELETSRGAVKYGKE